MQVHHNGSFGNCRFESCQFGRMYKAVLEYEPCHLSAAHFCVYDDGAFAAFLYRFELRRNDVKFARYAPPVEEAFHFGACQIDQHSIVGLHGPDEIIREQGFPMLKAAPVIVGR